MDPQNDFFTFQSLATFAGAVGSTTVVANGLERAFKFNPAWLGLALAEIICLSVVFFTHMNPPAGTVAAHSDYFVAVINGFLVFCSAAGASSLGAGVSGGGTAGPTATARGDSPSANRRGKGGFFKHWF